ncbi:Mu transposase domain-containing protein [Roseateles sp. P5_E11]
MLTQFKPARVNIDYHVVFGGHHCSVPRQHVGAAVELRITAGTLEVLLRRQRIAAHALSHLVGDFTTVAGDQRCGRSSSILLAECVGKRSSKS